MKPKSIFSEYTTKYILQKIPLKERVLILGTLKMLFFLLNILDIYRFTLKVMKNRLKYFVLFHVPEG